MMNELKKAWKQYDVDDYPYSGALGMADYSDASGNSVIRTGDDLFRAVLDKSFYSWKTAADMIRTGYYLTEPEIRGQFI